MKYPTKISFVVFILSILFSCSDGIPIDKQLILERDGLKIKVLFHSIEYHEHEDGISTFLKGKVFVRNISNDSVTYNLGNICIAAGQDTSLLYLDSIASVIHTDKKLAVNESMEANVYWAFQGKHTEAILNKLSLVYKRAYFEKY